MRSTLHLPGVSGSRAPSIRSAKDEHLSESSDQNASHSGTILRSTLYSGGARTGINSGDYLKHRILDRRLLVIARKDGEQVRLWARTTSDYSKSFTRIRDAVAALPVETAVLDGEAIVLRPDNTSDFEALRSRQAKQRPSLSPTT